MTLAVTPRRRAPLFSRKQFLWALFLLVDLIVVLLFMGGIAAAHVPPEHAWFLQLIALAIPYLGVGVVGGALGTLLLKRWALFAFHAAVLLAALIGTTPAAPSVARTASDDASMLRLITFNARGSVLYQYRDFQKLLDTAQPHLIAFQELGVKADERGVMWGGGAAVPILREAGLTLSRADDDQRALTSEPIFSRLDTVQPVRILAGSSAEGIWESGGVTRAVYRWDGRLIAVYSVHLHSFAEVRPWKEGWRRAVSPKVWRTALQAYRSDFRIRAEQARILRRMLDAEPYPFIVSGDLNSTPGTWVYAHLARGLRDAFGEAGRGWGATFPARFPLIRIDFVFVSEEWNVRDARVDKTVFSDHLPVVVSLSLPSPATPAER